MNPDLSKLHPYPFERLQALKSQVQAPAGLEHIPLSIGEPKHQPPEFVARTMNQHLQTMASYPLTKGIPALRQAICLWLQQRFQLPANSLDAEQHVLPVTGTREALFAFAQAVVDRNRSPLVIMPNPFYQIYEGAALLAGAEPWYQNTTADGQYLPDFDAVPADIWQRCQLIYICTPGNPTGAVIPLDKLQQLIQLAEKYDFIIASDECYSEIYFEQSQPPVGLLQAAAAMGNDQYKRCVVFHSLSKRSNVPGLRSGFVAGDADIMQKFLKFRTYHGCAMPEFSQHTSIELWQDEQHVIANRRLYQQKFDAVLEILSPYIKVARPDAGFYLWPETPIDDESFAQGLFAQQNITVLPGSYLSRQTQGINPGSHRVRIALVADQQQCLEAAQRIKTYLQTLD